MAALMVVGLIPTGFTAITAKASAGKKYSFEASSLEAASAGKFKDSETVKAGTDDYFTLYMSAKTKIDSSSKTWDDGYIYWSGCRGFVGKDRADYADSGYFL